MILTTIQKVPWQIIRKQANENTTPSANQIQGKNIDFNLDKIFVWRILNILTNCRLLPLTKYLYGESLLFYSTVSHCLRQNICLENHWCFWPTVGYCLGQNICMENSYYFYQLSATALDKIFLWRIPIILTNCQFCQLFFKIM